jgi:hypothetical protein
MSLPLVSQIFDPLYHSNSRTEFKVFGRDKVYLSKMRVSSFGVSAIVNDALPAPIASFNIEGGVFSLIKQASLYFNDILVDQVKDVSKVLSIQNNIMSSYTASNIAYVKTCTGIVPEWDAENPTMLNVAPISHKLLGLINLEFVFPVLRSTTFLPDIFEIRVVFEYESNKNLIFATPIPQNFTVSEPKLIIDESMDMKENNKILNMPLSVQVPCILTERVVVSASNNPQSIRLRAFDGMNLLRLVSNSVINNQPDELLCSSVSNVINSEVINFMVNGAKLLPFRGLDHPQKKQYIACSSMGDYLAPFGSADNNLIGDALDTFEDVYSGRLVLATSGKLAYTAVDINNRVNRLDFEVSKQLAQTIYYYFYGMVFKYLVKKGDVVETGYI